MTTVRARYFPASVVLPDGRTFHRRYVLLAEGGEQHGLWVWARPDLVEVRAPIDWFRTPAPKTGRAARNGVPVELADGGTAVITLGAGCRCGALGRWRGPDWATNVASSA